MPASSEPACEQAITLAGDLHARPAGAPAVAAALIAVLAEATHVGG